MQDFSVHFCVTGTAHTVMFYVILMRVARSALRVATLISLSDSYSVRVLHTRETRAKNRTARFARLLWESWKIFLRGLCVVLQGSSAFVYGWVAFCDRLSNGVTVKIIQQFAPQSTTEWELFETVTSTPTANNMAVCSSGRVNGPLRCLYFVTRTKSPVLVLYTKPLVRVWHDSKTADIVVCTAYS